jgi:hypothetical protein
MQTCLHNMHDMHFLTGRHAPPQAAKVRHAPSTTRAGAIGPSPVGLRQLQIHYGAASSAISMSLKQRQVLQRSVLLSSLTILSDSLPQRNHVTRLNKSDSVWQGCAIVDHRDSLAWVVRPGCADKRSSACLFDLVSAACTCCCRTLRVARTASVQGNGM